MLLDSSWETEAIKIVGSYNREEYLMGVEAFQQKAIEDLEQLIKNEPEDYTSNIGLNIALKIIKNLKK